jgi:hypothetical protein
MVIVCRAPPAYRVSPRALSGSFINRFDVPIGDVYGRLLYAIGNIEQVVFLRSR